MNRDVLTLLGGHIVNSKHQYICIYTVHCMLHEVEYERVCFVFGGTEAMHVCVCPMFRRWLVHSYTVHSQIPWHHVARLTYTTYSNFFSDNSHTESTPYSRRWRESITFALADRRNFDVCARCACASSGVGYFESSSTVPYPVLIRSHRADLRHTADARWWWWRWRCARKRLNHTIQTNSKIFPLNFVLANFIPSFKQYKWS